MVNFTTHSPARGVEVADELLDKLLDLMPKIAETVNRFESAEVQRIVLYMLVKSADTDDSWVSWVHRVLEPAALGMPPHQATIGLDNILGEDGLAQVMEKLAAASHRWSEQEAPHLDAFTPDELRQLAAQAEAGEPVSLSRT